MISTIELKKCMASTGILGIIVNKLCHKKKLCPIILLKVDKNLQIGFHYTILSLSLAICLRVESGKKSLLNVEEIAQQ